VGRLGDAMTDDARGVIPHDLNRARLVENGAAKVTERPMQGDARFEPNLTLDGQRVVAELVAKRCVTTTKVPTTVTEVTRTEEVSRGVVVAYYLLAALMGISSYALFNEVPNKPDKCPDVPEGTEQVGNPNGFRSASQRLASHKRPYANCPGPPRAGYVPAWRLVRATLHVCTWLT
jgi:hypothetical protein